VNRRRPESRESTPEKYDRGRITGMGAEGKERGRARGKEKKTVRIGTDPQIL